MVPDYDKQAIPSPMFGVHPVADGRDVNLPSRGPSSLLLDHDRLNRFKMIPFCILLISMPFRFLRQAYLNFIRKLLLVAAARSCTCEG
ncbi:hypothetical protein BJX64DRAFT_256590 [Aspergillus heterothallicus]